MVTLRFIQKKDQKFSQHDLVFDEKEPSYSEKDIEKKPLYQEWECASFNIFFENNKETIKYAELYINSEKIGNFSVGDRSGGFIFFPEKNRNDYFLLYNGFVVLSLRVYCADKEVSLYSKFILVLSACKKNNKNIENMLDEINNFTDVIVYDQSMKTTVLQKYSTILGSWKRNALRSFDSYIQMIESFLSFFKKTYPFFQVRACHTIRRYQEVMDYEKVRNFSQKEFLWLMKHSENFSRCDSLGIIQEGGQSYFPIKSLGERSIKDRNVYENKIILAFLNELIFNVSQLEESFSKKEQSVSKLQSIVNQIQNNSNGEYTSSIAIIKLFQQKKLKEIKDRLSEIKVNLLNILPKYAKALACDSGRLTSLPKKTKIFQEVNQYKEVYECIIKWVKFGEFSLDQKDILFKVKSVDVLYEYYCLIWLIKTFLKDGWLLFPDKDACSYYYEYFGTQKSSEIDLCNTYRFRKGKYFLTIYYQPYIYTNIFENDLSLFRTTLSEREEEVYYTPDFIIKVSSDGIEKYAILDAKYSQFSTTANRYLPNILQKYYIGIAEKSGACAIKMILAFQGRMDDSRPFFLYSNSVLAKKYGPSFGVFSVNSEKNCDREFLYEFSKRML